MVSLSGPLSKRLSGVAVLNEMPGRIARDDDVLPFRLVKPRMASRKRKAHAAPPPSPADKEAAELAKAAKAPPGLHSVAMALMGLDALEEVSSGEDRSLLAPTTDKIIFFVADFFSVKVKDIRSHRRTRDITTIRQICAYMIHILTPRTTTEIGRIMGGKDHTTIMHSIRKIEGRRLVDPEFDRMITWILSKFGGGNGPGTNGPSDGQQWGDAAGNPCGDRGSGISGGIAAACCTSEGGREAG